MLAALMGAGIWFDATQRRLPNVLVIATLVGGALTAMVEFGPSALGSNALHCAVALAITVALYAIGWIGAGDAKFYAAVAAWFPISQALDMLLMISVLGLALVLVWLVMPRVVDKDRSARQRTAKFPLGVPIAVGALAQFARYVLMPVT